MKEEGRGKKEEGRGKREEGRGKREEEGIRRFIYGDTEPQLKTGNLFHGRGIKLPAP
ncbi:MAG: hypothetical protein KME60_26100 [Cyanomargarita calcarea GSE-NOS-MK-12-04C]|jgi:hypothetical protein|uniref:Uncharacterized protein n=1 Tax=Cyanomargarita calcarea GSE-NOS-MK-12-04C TaxID=2839659 RepID=A0A951UXZ6_9CYAN|nr:hypothetical protein [Cyanomargarita calcarea GSE-NOS-MK-12-04C]